MNKIQLILNALKPKVKSLGFNKKELQGIAAKIADNLKSSDEASEEDVNAEIEAQIDAVLPILEFGQKYANRVIGEAKKNEDGDDDGNPVPPSKSVKSNVEPSNDVPAWAKALIESNSKISAELANLKGERLADTRKVKLEKLLKDTGTFGSRTLKSFAKMKFDSDEDFEEFYTEVESDLKALNQERANAGLANLGAPAVNVTNKKSEENNVLSDEDIKALANVKS